MTLLNTGEAPKCEVRSAVNSFRWHHSFSDYTLT